MATVTDFSEAELWYIYEALTTQTFAGATQQEIYEIFNGTNPQGKAISLFENQTVNKTSIADILYFSNNYLNAIDNNIGQIENWTDLTHTYLSTVRTPFLTSITGSLTIAVQIHNLSVYNSGASAGTINVDGGGAISIPAGVTVNFDAGGNNNRYAINKFVLNATGTTFIVSYTQ
jgi:hypothetical protein